MTAPHGPSQQEVIRQSMREAGLSPNMITIAECHGTGAWPAAAQLSDQLSI